MTFEHLAQAVQRVDLDLPDPIARDPDLLPDLLERFAPIAVQPEAPFDDGSLLVVEFPYPVIDDFRYIIAMGSA